MPRCLSHKLDTPCDQGSAATCLVFMGKSRLDSRRLRAIYTPWCCVAFGEEATVMTVDQRQWL
jgi:hypothetical protein